MPRVGSFVFREETTVAESRTEFVFGRVRRVVTLAGVLNGFSSRSAYEAAIAEVRRELERFDRGETDFSLTAGRFIEGRRRRFDLVRNDAGCFAAVHLEILAADRYERSESESAEVVAIAASPQTVPLEPDGNWPALPRLRLEAVGTIVNPSFSDGTRTLSAALTLAPGDVLELDGENRTASKNGSENVLHLISGEFPEVHPAGTDLEYADETPGGPDATLTVAWRDLWV